MLNMFYPLRRRVVVNTRSDRAFRGILWRKSMGLLVLKDVELLKTKGETVSLDGEVVIMRDNVDFIQVV